MDAREKLRWDTVGADAQRRLFGSDLERVTHPEFEDMEFLHVPAKSIVNEVPNAAHLPFRYTINVYRGCSHACSYCLSGGTAILMADGRTKSLADVRAGDHLFGTVRRGRYRRYVTTEVLDQWQTVKPAFRIELADGTEITASADHRFLTDRGWKHVTGAYGGSLQRPHLTTNNSMLGTGAFVDPPKDTPDYRLGYLCGMIRGDGHLGSYSYERPGRSNGDVHRFRLALVDDEALDRTRGYFRDLGLDFSTYLFKEETATCEPVHAFGSGSREVVRFVEDLIEWPSAPSDEWWKGFLAGIFDAEGSYSGDVLRFSNGDREILAYIVSGLHLFGFDNVLEPPRENGCRCIRITGGLREHLRFFHTVDPAITRKRTIPEGYALKSDADLRVVSVEPLGVDVPMFDITTGTGDFIANGVVSHNCFARPTHEYLNLNAGRDFERVIVVKVNAVDLLRAELQPRRWAGEHIAMGTNTDPYQRCEGRYELTRGVLEVLTEQANPFSILTKSSLVLRDLDVLTEANDRTDVAVNFSVGTLDDEVWRSTEPGTPKPQSRLDAVAQLRDRGIRSGVLIAPIIPGISDGREQLEEVVKACIDAGASSITPIMLHLRPGVKEQFMPWLADARPDLLPRYEHTYRRSYAPKQQRRRIGRLVSQLVREHGGPVGNGDRRNARERDEAQNRPEQDPTEQLSLGL